MEKSESIANIAKALVKFNGLVGKIKKDSKNPFFKSNYAALPNILDAIHQPLLECDLTVNQFPTGQNGLTTIVIHALSGEYLMDSYIMKPVKDDPQGLGSSITYQRRYALGAALGLNIDEDDDGNKASNKVLAPASKPNQQNNTPTNPLKPSEVFNGESALQKAFKPFNYLTQVLPLLKELRETNEDWKDIGLCADIVTFEKGVPKDLQTAIYNKLTKK